MIEETIKKISEYHDTHFNPDKHKDKVFYHHTEWEGWSFYKKALKYKDFRSIWGHIKSKFRKV